jgi:protein transport protein SEC24
MNLVDIDACIGIIAREEVSQIGIKTLKEVRDSLRQRVVETFAHYRKFSSSNMPPTQLLMPVALRDFIIYVLALQKSRALRNAALSSDTRVNCVREICSMSADELSLYLYPRIVGLHNLEPEDCTYTEHGLLRMPENVRATLTALEDGGAYLLYNSRELYLWLHSRVSPNLLTDLFGVRSLEELDPCMNALPELDTKVSEQARALVDYYAKESKVSFLGIQLARQTLDGAEQEFYAMLVEDRHLNAYSYQDFVANVHKNVKIYIENSNSRATRAILNDY